MNVRALRACWSLYGSDSSRETYIAVALAGVVLAPVVVGVWRER